MLIFLRITIKICIFLRVIFNVIDGFNSWKLYFPRLEKSPRKVVSLNNYQHFFKPPQFPGVLREQSVLAGVSHKLPILVGVSLKLSELTEVFKTTKNV